jgi:hypothetical protein
LELSRLEEICSRFFTAGRIEPGDPLRMVARQSTWRSLQGSKPLGGFACIQNSLRSPFALWVHFACKSLQIKNLRP